MQFIKSWQFMAIIVGVLGVVAILGVIYGVVTHTEAGFMDGGAPWEREDMPLGLCVDSYGTPGHTDVGDLENAAHVVGLINGRLGFTAYELSGDDCDVTLTYGVPVEAGWQDPGGSAALAPGHCYAVTANVHGELRTLTAYHELGHCLGLDHDDFRQSIMFGGEGNHLQATPARTIPPWISDSDRRLLRMAYEPE